MTHTHAHTDDIDAAVARMVDDWHAAARHAAHAARGRARTRAAVVAYEYGTLDYRQAHALAVRARGSARRAATRAQRAARSRCVLWATDAAGVGRPVDVDEHAMNAAYEADVAANNLAALRALGRRRGDDRE